jgi:hypothetical protein
MARAMLDAGSSPVVPARASVSPVGYTPFSPRLAPSLTVAGGLLAIVGGLGLWVRAVAVTDSGIHQTATVTGFGRGAGWLIAALGVLALAGSFVRFSSSRWLLAAASIAAVVLMAMRISNLSRQSSQMAFRAGTQAGRTFTAYHAGFGWGAWAMTLAAVLMTLGTIVMLLGWLDERKGLAR